VDTQFTLGATAEVLAALRQITDRPVSTLINTHWHDDHTFGNQIYRQAFPGLRILAHANTQQDLATVGVENRKQQVEGGPETLALFRDAVATGRSLDGTPMSPEERAAYRNTIDIVVQYLEDVPHFELTPPTETFADRLTLQQGSRVIELRHFGPSVTRGDAVVCLPKERVLIAGDVVDEPVPFAYGCHVAGWLSTLKQLRALSPRIIVPGHGPVMHDAAQIDRLAGVLASIQKQAAAGVERGETLEELRPKLDLEEARLVMAGSDKMLGFIFRTYFAWPALANAYEEARGKP